MSVQVSDAVIVALIGMVGVIVAALISALATVIAAWLQSREPRQELAQDQAGDDIRRILVGWSSLTMGSSWRRRCQPTNVVLVDRATTVPFTAVTTGPQRTPTDNHTVAMICAVCRLPR